MTGGFGACSRPQKFAVRKRGFFSVASFSGGPLRPVRALAPVAPPLPRSPNSSRFPFDRFPRRDVERNAAFPCFRRFVGVSPGWSPWANVDCAELLLGHVVPNAHWSPVHLWLGLLHLDWLHCERLAIISATLFHWLRANDASKLACADLIQCHRLPRRHGHQRCCDRNVGLLADCWWIGILAALLQWWKHLDSNDFLLSWMRRIFFASFCYFWLHRRWNQLLSKRSMPITDLFSISSISAERCDHTDGYHWFHYHGHGHLLHLGHVASVSFGRFNPFWRNHRG